MNFFPEELVLRSRLSNDENLYRRCLGMPAGEQHAVDGIPLSERIRGFNVSHGHEGR